MTKACAGAIAVALLRVNALAQTAGAKLDHVMIAVRDLDAAKLVYSGLGFSVLDGGRHPGGTQNDVVAFNGGGYLELITPYDASLPDGKSMTERLKKGEGALEAGLEVASAEQTARDLSAAGLKIKGPTPGTIKLPNDKDPPPTRWWNLEFTEALPWRPVFLIQYGPGGKPPVISPGPNSATSMSALLVAVNDPEKAVASYGNIGKARDGEISLPEFGAMAKEIVLYRGSILLLRATNPEGLTARRLKERGEGIIGLRIAISDLEQARKQLGNKNVSRIQQSALVSPENASGVWLEFQVARP
jgi:catechol 2,3-dioxygenase-like lactoylglutathione lyase family enzyme